MGTPDFATAILKAVAARHEVVAVYTQPPRPAGKGMRLTKSPVHVLAEELGLKVRTPLSLKDAQTQADFRALGADVGVVCAYGLILPPAILEAPPKGCINVHASLLPRWRGAAPIQRCIQAGDAETGITTMQMDAGLDTGDMLMVAQTPLTPDMTAGKLHDVLAKMGADLIVRTLDEEPTPFPQPSAGMTYAPKIQKEEAEIDWTKPAFQIERDIRAFNPYPTAWFRVAGERVKVFAAEVAEKTNEAPGTVLDGGLRIACGNGTSLRLLVVQRAGKRVMQADELLRGFHLPKGTLLSCAIA